MKITIIGPYPPPYDGGISIHTKRFRDYLVERGIHTSVYNESKAYKNISDNIYTIESYRKFVFKMLFLNSDIFHFHTIDIKVRIILGLYKVFGKKIVLTIHGESVFKQITNSNIIIRKLLLISLNHIDKIICVNEKIINDLIHFGINRDKLACIPAYCDPIETEDDFAKIDKKVWNFVNNSNFLICANGSIRFYNNEDLYGFDLLIELIYKLKQIGRDMKLIIALLSVAEQNANEDKYYNELKERIKKQSLEDNIFIFEVNDTEFYPIMKKSQLFIRPTNTDGDAVSIREALYYKIPSIASNVTKRPEGTILFQTRNIEDLFNKVDYVIENYDICKIDSAGIEVESNEEKLLKIYTEILK